MANGLFLLATTQTGLINMNTQFLGKTVTPTRLLQPHIIHYKTGESLVAKQRGRSSLCQELDCTIFYVSHLRKASGTPHEDERNTTTLRVLKDRNTGLATGVTFKLKYHHTTGRWMEIDAYLEAKREEEIQAILQCCYGYRDRLVSKNGNTSARLLLDRILDNWDIKPKGGLK
jgi:hypothetical protein